MEAVYSFITGESLLLSLLAFIAVSYVIVGLLTWSFIKPLKYLGFPIVIVGLISFGLKSILALVLETMDLEGAGIIKIFINSSGNLFIKYAVICLITGAIMIASYYALNITLKTGKTKKSNKSESYRPYEVEAETEPEIEHEVEYEDNTYEEDEEISE